MVFMGRQECCVLPGPGPELPLHHRGAAHHSRKPRHFSHTSAETQSRSWIEILFLSLRLGVRTSVQWIDELSFHHAFIGPLYLNAEFLELAVKRGSCETQDVGAFFYIAGGAFECLHNRFTLNLPHRH